MTGEMSWIKEDGEDSRGDSYPVHAAVAKALGCKLEPFDVYTGPYIDHPKGKLWLSSDDGCIGQVCLWPGGAAPAHCEPVVQEYGPYDDIDQAIAIAKGILE